MLERYEKLIHQGELPRLRIVPLSRILFHEETEPARVRRVAGRLEEDGVLRHPAIVAGSPRSRRFLLLDGAHRTMALRALGLKHVLVQIVDYRDRLIELDRWHHLLDCENPDRFLEHVQGLRGVTIHRHRAASSPNPFASRRTQYAQIIMKDRRSFQVLPEPDPDREHPHWLEGALCVLRQLCALYRERGFLDRISYDEFDWIEQNYHRFTALITFPHFTKMEVQRIARLREKLPAGVTRHLIPKRALRFNLPLWVLARNLSAEELNRRLVQIILDRIEQGRIRFYSESTFNFDE